MQSEEAKVSQKDLCANCSVHMKVMSDYEPPNMLTCGHEVCLKCVFIGMPQE